MLPGIQLIVGLANPGEKYAQTRHNAGAWFIDQLATQANAALRPESKFHGLYTQAKLYDQTCHFLIPTTYMNLSGQAVQACMRYLKLAPTNLLVVHDEVDLPAGIIRLKYDGGDGGHNGLKDIISHLHTKQFYRLRIGVGRPMRGEVVDYVLDRPSKADKNKINTAMEAVDEVMPLVLKGDMQKAMTALHTEK